MNTWHKRFDTAQYMYGESPNAFIKSHVDALQDHKEIAAFAEGEGRNAVFLAQKGHVVTAFDYAESGLTKTTQLANKNQVTVNTVLCDLINDDLPVQQFDGAIMVFGHFHKTDQFHVLDKIMTSVKQGGIVMIEVYSETQLHYKTGGPPDQDWLYDAKQVLAWCEHHKILHFFTGEQMRTEGILHTGLAHTVQFIIQKTC
ncbi:methyltransferase [Lysinibacillus alkalisoli]|uniref:Methyltransferase n=2 Tax=Lysinibacillus alkalisoli TaxID=1911548 RepID=A0A917LGA0_9BACI|nr:methyltransferase [Lysinibacillus alkalisoli]